MMNEDIGKISDTLQDSFEVEERTLIEDVQATQKALERKKGYIEKVATITHTLSIFGFSVEPALCTNGFLLKLRTDKRCIDLLPVFEYLEQQGARVTATNDIPYLYNREYILRLGNTTLILDVYFSNCTVIKKEVQKTVTEVSELRCNLTEAETPRASNEDDDLPF